MGTDPLDLSLSVDQLLRTKREGRAFSPAQVRAWVDLATQGQMSHPQIAALLAFITVRGMSDAETVVLTEAMRDSGRTLCWPEEGGLLVDKHSTGGVGDKVSLVLAPLWAELGFRVPMISGRGLGHTGGTLDKLESIPGFRTDLGAEALTDCLAQAGCFIAGQTADLVPADRLFYALRDETGTVPSIPLIVASILSKKLAEGVQRLVLDVKYGSGAFMQSRPEALLLAGALARVGQGAGLDVRTVLSPMDRPLGRAVGNALEVVEAVACLQGGGPADLRDTVLALADHPAAAEVLASGRAYARFERMVRAQGGDPSAPLLGLAACEEAMLLAPRSGRFGGIDALAAGRAAVALGAGRQRAGEAVHPGVGLELLALPGDDVQEGDALVRVLHAGVGLGPAMAMLSSGLDWVNLGE